MEQSVIRKLAYPAIDGIRFFAAFAVFLDHLVSFYWTDHLHRTHSDLIAHTGNIWTYLADGDHGVDIFFVISGFLMARLVCGKRDFNYFGFVGARFRRIYPALAAAVIFAVATRCLLVNWPFYPLQFAANLALLNAFPALGIVDYIVVTWSVALELLFYLVIPVILIGRRVADVRVVAVVLLVVAYFVLPHAPAPMGRMIGLFVGVIVGSFDDRSLSEFARRAPLLPLATLYLGCGLLKWLTPISFAEWRMLFLPITALLFVKIVWDETNIASRLFSSRVMRFLGTISYSFYLLHASVIYLIVARFMPADPTLGLAWYVVGSTAISLALSYASYMLIERWYFTAAKRRKNLSVPDSTEPVH